MPSFEQRLGTLDRNNTFFVFYNNLLQVANLALVVEPSIEDNIWANFSAEFKAGNGEIQGQGTRYFWTNKKNVYSETLVWSHGLR